MLDPCTSTPSPPPPSHTCSKVAHRWTDRQTPRSHEITFLSLPSQCFLTNVILLFVSPFPAALGNTAIDSSRSIRPLLFSGRAGVFLTSARKTAETMSVGWFGLTRCPALLDRLTGRGIRLSRTRGREERNIFQVFPHPRVFFHRLSAEIMSVPRPLCTPVKHASN